MQGVITATTENGLNFITEDGYRIKSGQQRFDSGGYTAAEILAADEPNEDLSTMYVSAWQDVGPGAEVPIHPSRNPKAVSSGISADFAAASIACDISGYRSRIYAAHSDDDNNWEIGECVVEGDGYGGSDPDAIHAEDMSLIKLDDGRYRMYYAACDIAGNWRILSAVSN